jgi:hypothetical protein
MGDEAWTGAAGVRRESRGTGCGAAQGTWKRDRENVNAVDAFHRENANHVVLAGRPRRAGSIWKYALRDGSDRYHSSPLIL